MYQLMTPEGSRLLYYRNWKTNYSRVLQPQETHDHGKLSFHGPCLPLPMLAVLEKQKQKNSQSIQLPQQDWQQQRGYILGFSPQDKYIASCDTMNTYLNSWFCISIIVQTIGPDRNYHALNSVTILFYQSSGRKLKNKTLLIRFVSNRKQLVCW